MFFDDNDLTHAYLITKLNNCFSHLSEGFSFRYYFDNLKIYFAKYRLKEKQVFSHTFIIVIPVLAQLQMRKLNLTIFRL